MRTSDEPGCVRVSSLFATSIALSLVLTELTAALVACVSISTFSVDALPYACAVARDGGA
jgi:hypothetical protein